MAERIDIPDEPLDEQLMEDVIEVTADGEEVPRQGVDIFERIADIERSDEA